jgi:DNA-binding CsgD family transcriptional regulator
MALGKHHLLTLNQLNRLAEEGANGDLNFESISRKVVGIIQKAVHFDSAWFLKVDPLSFNIQEIYLYRFNQRAFSKYLDDFYVKAPIPTLRQIKNEGFISKKGSDLIEYELWLENPFYSEIIKPLGLQSFLSAACINLQHEYVGYMVFWRGSERNDFSSQDCFFFEKASSSVAQLFSRVRRINQEVDKPEILKLVNRRSNPGVIILGQGNAILFINQEARNILTIIQSGKAHFSNNEDEKFMQKLFLLKEKRKFDLFTFRGTTYSCRPIPLEGNPAEEGSVMLLIETVQEEPIPRVTANEAVPEFTARERAVAGLISRGMTNKEISTELGIGIHTVKDHIKNIMDKLGTHTRSGIVSRLLIK